MFVIHAFWLSLCLTLALHRAAASVSGAAYPCIPYSYTCPPIRSVKRHLSQGAFSFCAFDLHLLPCTTLIAAAQSTCLGKNEKERVLASCESPSDTFRRQDKEVIQASRIGKVFHDLLAALSNEAYQSE